MKTTKQDVVVSYSKVVCENIELLFIYEITNICSIV